ncbi:hypothetical protein, partial [Rhizobium sp. RHZ01]|uniref:hypothetical protein n=1 Tax=Rhizobium sp. RHZ01 TaxID=2769304 RepID=UPI001AEDB987
GNLKLILQGNSPFGGCFRQLEDLQILRFLCLISSFRVLHGRLNHMELGSNVWNAGRAGALRRSISRDRVDPDAHATSWHIPADGVAVPACTLSVCFLI